MPRKRTDGSVMTGIKRDLDCHGEPIRIIVLADLHVGDKHCNVDLIKNLIQKIKDDENMYVILAGDLMNTALSNSPSDVFSETMRPTEQMEFCRDMLMPIRDRILAIVPGNHEERISRSVGTDMSRILACELGLQDVFSDTTALLFLRFGKTARKGTPIVYSLYISHGNGGGKRAGSKINSLEDLANVITCDCYVCGHTHLPATFKRRHFIPSYQTYTAVAHEQLFINTASALNYGGYGRRGGYAPSSNSYPIITLDDREHRMTATV